MKSIINRNLNSGINFVKLPCLQTIRKGNFYYPLMLNCKVFINFTQLDENFESKYKNRDIHQVDIESELKDDCKSNALLIEIFKDIYSRGVFKGATGLLPPTWESVHGQK